MSETIVEKINPEVLPQIAGTEKQIKWANEIREKCIQSFNEYLEAGLCQDGYEAELAEHNAREAKRIEEFIAENGLEAADGEIRWFKRHKEEQKEYKKYISFIAEKFATETSSKWWIEVGRGVVQTYKPLLVKMYVDWKDGHDQVGNWLSTQRRYVRTGSHETSTFYEEFLEWCKLQDLPADVREELAAKESTELEEALIVPEEVTTTTKATIYVDGSFVNVSSDKDSVIVKACKKCGFKWDGSTWSREFYPSLTDPSDAIAEIANALLVAGAAVIVKDPEARRKAVDGTYEPIPTRVISGNKEKGKIYISWDAYNDSIYSDARKIKGSKWNRPSVEVSPDQYLDIEGFAERWGFVLTPTAQALIDEAKEKIAAVAVKVTKGEKYTPAEFDGEAILQSEAKVMDRHKLI